MIGMQHLIRYVGAEPFRPFRINMAGGQAFEIRHPEMIHVGRSTASICNWMSEKWEETQQRESNVPLMLMESVELIEFKC